MTILSFYSYKGGVGRSMALANVGVLLAARAHAEGKSVLLVDWDLEAPGLEHYFRSAQAAAQPGLIDYFISYYPDCTRGAAHRDPPVKLPFEAHCFPLAESPGLAMMSAGRQDTNYPGRVWSFDWRRLHQEHPGALAAFRAELESRYEYVLIDSRTGVTDISGISTAMMADKLVVVFAPNRQNREGLARVIPELLSYRGRSDDDRPLTVFPVLSRVDWSDLANTQAAILDAIDTFSELFVEQYGLDEARIADWVNDTMLPYVSGYAFRERLAAGSEEPSHPGSLRAAYGRLANRLLDEVPWRDD